MTSADEDKSDSVDDGEGEFVIEKNVRKAIIALELLTSKVVKKDISTEHIVESLLDQLSTMRIILGNVLSYSELSQSKSRIEKLLR